MNPTVQELWERFTLGLKGKKSVVLFAEGTEKGFIRLRKKFLKIKCESGSLEEFALNIARAIEDNM